MERVIPLILVIIIFLSGCQSGGSNITSSFFTDTYKSEINKELSYIPDTEAFKANSPAEFLYERICYSEVDVYKGDEYPYTSTAAACFDIDNASVIYSKNVYNKVYPASTTKLITALAAVKYGDLNAVVEIKEDNCGINTWGAQLCGFKKGDRITVSDLLYCLLIYSGNDAGKALAEFISGSEQEFVKLMNKECLEIGAFDSHFVNSHGLHDPNHYTTAYDMYLIFNECLKYDLLKEIFRTSGYYVNITDALGEVREMYVEPTNLYYKGDYTAPDGIKVLGGKTGDTNAAGKCLVLYSEDEEGHCFITELFKSETKAILYGEMNELFKMCLEQ